LAEAIRRDPGTPGARRAASTVQKARHADAETHPRGARTVDYRHAIRWTGSHLYLGLTLKAQGKYEDAFPLLQKATWSIAWRAPGYYEAAEIASLRGDLAGALAYADRSLDANMSNLRAWNLKAAVLRHMGRTDAALAALTAGQRIDPLDARSMAERWLVTRRDDGRLLRATLGSPRARRGTGAEY
jgi:tetratricopeptide (TPR) repeat protein